MKRNRFLYSQNIRLNYLIKSKETRMSELLCKGCRYCVVKDCNVSIGQDARENDKISKESPAASSYKRTRL